MMMMMELELGTPIRIESIVESLSLSAVVELDERVASQFRGAIDSALALSSLALATVVSKHRLKHSLLIDSDLFTAL